MREMLFKNLTSENLRKKDVLLREVFARDGLVAKTERRCFYFIKEVIRFDGEEGLQNWIESHCDSNEYTRRHFHIMREHNDKMGEDKVICKIAGTFYAVANRRIYAIGFLHSFKVRLMKVTVAN